MHASILRATLVSIALVALSRADVPSVAGITADSARSKLIEGNGRFRSDQATHPHQDSARRRETAKGQNPFAIVLTCADSRVPAEVLFDQGVGDIFVVRVAGNVAGVNETASVEYAAEHLNVPLCVVMGHSACGAVKAAVDGAELHDNLGSLMVEIAPAIERTKREHPDLRGAALLSAAIDTNVWYSIETLLRRSQVLRTRVRDGKLRIVGAVYDLASGEVRWLGPDPREDEILSSDPAAASARH